MTDAVGEDVTENVRTIKSVPQTLKGVRGRVEVRGEVFLAREDFLEMESSTGGAQGLREFANPRNAAAEACARSDPAATAKRPLSFLGYQLVDLGRDNELSAHVTIQRDDRNSSARGVSSRPPKPRSNTA